MLSRGSKGRMATPAWVQSGAENGSARLVARPPAISAYRVEEVWHQMRRFVGASSDRRSSSDS